MSVVLVPVAAVIRFAQQPAVEAFSLSALFLAGLVAALAAALRLRRYWRSRHLALTNGDREYGWLVVNGRARRGRALQNVAARDNHIAEWHGPPSAGANDFLGGQSAVPRQRRVDERSARSPWPTPGGNIKTNRAIYVTIPTGFNMTWDVTVTVATLSGIAARTVRSERDLSEWKSHRDDHGHVELQPG